MHSHANGVLSNKLASVEAFHWATPITSFNKWQALPRVEYSENMKQLPNKIAIDENAKRSR